MRGVQVHVVDSNMTACEKCWRDAHAIPVGDAVKRYEQLCRERQCTPEDQAGPAARWCMRCRRWTIHQHAGVCTACGDEPKP